MSFFEQPARIQIPTCVKIFLKKNSCKTNNKKQCIQENIGDGWDLSVAYIITLGNFIKSRNIKDEWVGFQ